MSVYCDQILALMRTHFGQFDNNFDYVLDQSERETELLYLEFHHCQGEPGVCFIDWLVRGTHEQRYPVIDIYISKNLTLYKNNLEVRWEANKIRVAPL